VEPDKTFIEESDLDFLLFPCGKVISVAGIPACKKNGSMKTDASTITAETMAARAFGSQAIIFDQLYGSDTTIRYKRDRVRAHVEQRLPAHASILELNAGTGEDAIYFAGKGHRVHATDIAHQMLQQLQTKVQGANKEGSITTELCDFTKLGQLNERGPYDLAFSNFAGLNCTGDLRNVLTSLSELVKPGGVITLVILPSFCLWESLLLFRGHWRTALRRFSGRKGSTAKIGDQHFRCWYYSPSFVRRSLPQFKQLDLEGLCTLVPPSYLEGVAEKYPRMFSFLKKMEGRLRRSWPWRLIGDYYIISMQKPLHPQE
jgi:ubiquinone/menaquinone biosynthesis C-methylase UbiE